MVSRRSSIHRTAAIVACACLLGGAGGRSAGQSDACAQAHTAYQGGRFAEAGPLFQSCRKSSGGDAAALLEAKSFLNSGHPAEAVTAGLVYLATKPKSAEGMYVVARACASERKARESLHWFTEAAALDPPTAEDLRLVGLDYVLLEDDADAIHWLERAVVLDPKYGEAWYDLGRAQMTHGDAGAAEVSLRTALRLMPRSVKAENNLGVNYEAQNKPREALAAYRLAAEWQEGASQQSEQPLLNLGTLLITQQRGAEAVAPLQKAEAIAPGNVKVHEQLARALEQAGDRDQALREMAEAVRLDGGSARLHYELGQMYKRAGRRAESQEELRISGKLYGAATPGK